MFAATHLRLDRSADTLREQLYRQLRDAVMSGRLASGSALPSTRAVAGALGIARSTVVEALDQLRAEGYLQTHQGAATRVATLQARWLGHAAPRAATPAAEQATQSHWANDDPPMPIGVRAFRVGLPDIAAFPAREWATHVARRARRPASHDLSYAGYCGVDALREQILLHVGPARHVSARAEQVIVLPSARTAFDLVARLSLEPGDTAWIEDPGYPGMRSLLQAHRARIVAVPVDAEGIAPGAVRGARPKLIYTTPSHQSPTGVTMSLRRRLELLDAAARAGANIVEDDYDSEFRYRGLPIASLQGLDRHGCVHYVGTFSKPLAPGLRVAYLIVPSRFVALATTIASVTGVVVPVHIQLALADFMADGGMRRHIRAMLPRYGQRIARLAAVLAARGQGLLTVPQPQGGLQLCVGLDARIDDVEASERLLDAGLRAMPVSRMSFAARRNGLQLGIGAVHDDEVEPAAERLCALLRELAGRQSTKKSGMKSFVPGVTL